MKYTIAVALLLGLSSAVHEYNYALHGSDWGTFVPAAGIVNECAKAGGSPIDLFTDLATKYTVYDISKDNLQTQFTNQVTTPVAWDHDTTKVSLLTGPNQFISNIGQDVFGIGLNQWVGASFVFHSGSEHKVNGARFDLEM